MNVPGLSIAVSGSGHAYSLESVGSRIVENYEDECLRNAVQDVLTWNEKKRLTYGAKLWL